MKSSTSNHQRRGDTVISDCGKAILAGSACDIVRILDEDLLTKPTLSEKCRGHGMFIEIAKYKHSPLRGALRINLLFNHCDHSTRFPIDCRFTIVHHSFY